uniref:Bestrophin homolog n=1 Tax=Alexandrium andersonii TaxID=327968 RepID=A0A7S2AG50_9DINO|mmetsp:Transcript_11419/g.25975  ORF Transcript_11419/g.25975 Transcript_11419/m.25975 type:complete len:555 (+) Transcript_11419:135-1799(+)
MIHYETDRWNIKFAFSLKGSVFPRSFVIASLSAAMTLACHIIMHQSEDISELVSVPSTGTQILSGFLFILGFLIVFRSQQAYARWWEGGAMMQQLRGQWYNAASCLYVFCDVSPEKRPEVVKFQHHIARLISLLYAFAISDVKSSKDKRLEVLEISGFEAQDLQFLQSPECHDPCEVVLQWVQRVIVHAEQTGILTISPPMLARVFSVLCDGMVNLCNGRKIMEFPIPFPLAQMITVMLLFHGISTPLLCAATIDSPYWACLICFVVCFSFWTINYIATELEMPFGEDSNDLPLGDMLIDMNQSLSTLLDEHVTKAPSFDYNELGISRRPGMMSVDFNSDLGEFCKDGTAVIYKHVERRSMTGVHDTRMEKLSAGELALLRSSSTRSFEETKDKEAIASAAKDLEAYSHEAEGHEDVHIEEAPRVDAMQASATMNASQTSCPEQVLASQVNSSAMSPLQGYCDFKPMVLMPRSPQDASENDLALVPRMAPSSSRARSRDDHSEVNTVIQVKAAACCMPLTPGARLDALPSMSSRPGALRKSVVPPTHGGKALQR